MGFVIELAAQAMLVQVIKIQEGNARYFSWHPNHRSEKVNECLASCKFQLDHFGPSLGPVKCDSS